MGAQSCAHPLRTDITILMPATLRTSPSMEESGDPESNVVASERAQLDETRDDQRTSAPSSNPSAINPDTGADRPNDQTSVSSSLLLTTL